jgi:DNA-binding NarL/FixJ family response regulator
MKKIRVVVIEDQTILRQLLTSLLSSDPCYEVVGESGGGREALTLCLNLEPDLVILDVMLPGLNGVDLLQRFSKQLQKTRVLVFSSHENGTLVQEMLKHGAHGFVEKNVPLSILQDAIRQVAEGGSYFGPAIALLLRDAVRTPGERPTALSPREREVLQLVAEGNSTKEIASKLNLSVKTVENHRTNLMRKLDLHDVASLTRYAIQIGLVAVNS